MKTYICYLITNRSHVIDMSKKSYPLGVRIEHSILEDLELISQIEGVGIPELIRGWIREKIAGYQRDRRYLAKKEQGERE